MPANRSYFLYGDSTESTLQTNFLEFLRDSIDFAVSAIQSDPCIEEIRARVRSLRAEAQRQRSELEAFVGSVHFAIDGAPKEADSPTAHCAVHITSLANDAKLIFVNFIEAKLQADLAQADADETAARNSAALALANLLAPYEPPDSTSTMNVGLGSAEVYQGDAEGNSLSLALDWSLALGDT